MEGINRKIRGLLAIAFDFRDQDFEFAGIEGLLRFATTAAFLQRFALSSLEELTSTSFRLIPTKHPVHTCAKSGALYRPQS
jgi:hypothetical protein